MAQPHSLPGGWFPPHLGAAFLHAAIFAAGLAETLQYGNVSGLILLPTNQVRLRASMALLQICPLPGTSSKPASASLASINHR